MPANFSRLPNELAEEIIKWIPRKRDLINLSLTCKGLHRIVVPVLYRDVYVPLQQPRTSKWEPMVTSGLLKASNRGPDHVRHLRFEYPKDLGNLPDYVSTMVKRIPSGTLRSVKFLGSSYTAENPSAFLVHLLRKQQKLVEIDIRWPPEFTGPWDELAPGFPYHALTTLTIGSKTTLGEQSVVTTAAFLSVAINVRNVSIYGGPDANVGMERVLAAVQEHAESRPKLQLTSFKVAKFDHLQNAVKTLAALFDFSKLESLTITNCGGSEALFEKVSMQQPYQKCLAGANIRRSGVNTPKLSQILPHCTALERLELYEVYDKDRELDMTQVLPIFITGIRGKVFNIRRLFLHSRQWSFDAAYYARGPELIKDLLNCCPKLEELMLDFPPWINPDSMVACDFSMSKFLEIIANAPKLRFLINTTQDACRHFSRFRDFENLDTSALVSVVLSNSRIPNNGKSSFQDAWMHHTITHLFHTCEATNPNLEVYGIWDDHRCRWFFRHPLLTATGKVETIVEEVWPKDMKFEKPAFDWTFESELI